MGAQSFNTEITGKLNGVTQYLRDDTFIKLRNGADAAIECAKETGSEKFLKESEAHKEAAEQLIKKFDSLCDCCDKYAEQNARIEAAL